MQTLSSTDLQQIKIHQIRYNLTQIAFYKKQQSLRNHQNTKVFG